MSDRHSGDMGAVGTGTTLRAAALGSEGQGVAEHVWRGGGGSYWPRMLPRHFLGSGRKSSPLWA